MEILEKQGIIAQIAEQAYRNYLIHSEDHSQMNALQKEKKRIQAQIDNFLEAIGNGLSAMSTKMKLEQLEQQLAEISVNITAE